MFSAIVRPTSHSWRLNKAGFKGLLGKTGTPTARLHTAGSQSSMFRYLDWCFILASDHGTTQSRELPRSMHCLCSPYSGGEWSLLCRGHLAAAIAIPLAAGCNSKSWRCALSLIACTCCSRNELRALLKSMTGARWSGETARRSWWMQGLMSGIHPWHP